MHAPQTPVHVVHNANFVHRLHLALSRVDVSASADLDTASRLVALTSQDARKIILVHKVAFPALAPLFLGGGSGELLLILGEDELSAPSSLSTAALPLAVGAASDGLGNAETVASVVPLHVLLQMHGKLAVGSRGARHTGKRIFTATRAELLVHFLGGKEAGMAALDE